MQCVPDPDATSIDRRVVEVAHRAGLHRSLGAPYRVEVHRSVVPLIIGDVDHSLHVDLLITEIGEPDARRLCERHEPSAGHRAIAFDAHRKAAIAVESRRRAEEVPDGTMHRHAPVEFAFEHALAQRVMRGVFREMQSQQCHGAGSVGA